MNISWMRIFWSRRRSSCQLDAAYITGFVCMWGTGSCVSTFVYCFCKDLSWVANSNAFLSLIFADSWLTLFSHTVSTVTVCLSIGGAWLSSTSGEIICPDDGTPVAGGGGAGTIVELGSIIVLTGGVGTGEGCVEQQNTLRIQLDSLRQSKNHHFPYRIFE